MFPFLTGGSKQLQLSELPDDPAPFYIACGIRTLIGSTTPAVKAKESVVPFWTSGSELEYTPGALVC